MAGEQNIDPQDPVSTIIGRMLPHRKPELGEMGGIITVSSGVLSGRSSGVAVLGSLQNPFDRPCLAAALADIQVVSATANSTISIGVDADGTTSRSHLLSAGDSDAAVAVLGGLLWRKLDEKGGANDHIVISHSNHDQSALRVRLIALLIPLP